MDMSADELLLRDRVHHAYEALDVRGPSTVAVLRHVESRVQDQRRVWAGAFMVAALAAVSVMGIQLVPRSVQLREASPGGVVTNSGSNAVSGASRPSGSPVQSAAQQRPSSEPCPPSDLVLSVNTDHGVYGMGDAIEITATVTNGSKVRCLVDGAPLVSVRDAHGASWKVCPERDWPPPLPSSTRAATMPRSEPIPMVIPGPAYANGGTASAAGAAGAAGAITSVTGGVGDPVLAFGTVPQSQSADCTWHTQYRNLRPGTYRVWASWGSLSASSAFSLLDLPPTPSTSDQGATPLTPTVP